jgi:uncharacterized protein YaiL (DUF2058 family)
MQNLRDQLLKAGLITEEQRQKAEANAERRPRGKSNVERNEHAPEKKAEKPKISKKALMKQPVNRMIDLSDPRLLKIFQAIEEHRLRESPKGEIPFHFSLRDGRVRKIFVKKSVFEGLEAGTLAIVENGEEERHQIVAAAAVAIICDVDPDAVRFFASASEPEKSE